MTTRRQFITQVAATAAFAAMTSSGFSLNRPVKVREFGFISGLIGKELKEDWKAALTKASRMGYTQIEIRTHLGDSVTEFLSFCRDLNITPVGGGIGMSKDKGEIERGLDSLAELKMKYAVTYWPWFTSAPFHLEHCKESVEALNHMGQLAKEKGLKFCWHNHDHEFKPMESGTPFDYLMTHTDPDLVRCEMDVYWVRKGGADPLTELKKYKGRYQALHIKDMTGDGTQDFACPGQGVIDFPSIFAEANKQKIRYFLVERDNAQNGMECLQVSSAYLKGIR